MNLLIVPLVTILLGAEPQNSVFVQMTREGLAADAEGKTGAKLAPPTMADGLDAVAQRRAIEEVARPKRRVEDLLKNAVVAPFVLEIKDVAGGRAAEPLRQVDVWYAVYGTLDQFFDEDFFQSLVDLAHGEKKSRLPVTKGVLKEADLRSRGIPIADAAGVKERYCYGTFDLFDRVLLSVTRHVVATRQADSVLVAAAIDSRFMQDAKYPNQWRAVKMDQRREFTLGPPQPYALSASYTKITRLHEPPGALWIEHHQLFAEPEGWFGGKNLLRSKLPLAVQESVRKLRWQFRGKQAEAADVTVHGAETKGTGPCFRPTLLCKKDVDLPKNGPVPDRPVNRYQ